ncbi:MAG: FGGY family carbohydrate kinase [Candidatus Omnitrophica bacterium]|nr:FGGY family carbohydrate kinase [Candidatus Omnitrophota bacterium]
MGEKKMVLVFDSGTTNTKAFLFDEKGEILAFASHPTNVIHPAVGMVEQKANFWWEAVIKATKKIQMSPYWKKNKISALSVSSQGGTFVLLDKNSSPLRPGITWLDSRGESISRYLNKKYGKEYFFKKTGHYLGNWSPPCVYLYLKKKEPSVISQMRKLSFVSDYLNFKLTGRFFLDPTAAQMSCFYNIVKGTWDKDILEIAGVKEENLPLVIGSYRIGGEVSEEASKILDIPEGIPVFGGGHDQYCASLGAGAVRKGDCLLSCGTAWALLVVTEGPVFIPGSGWLPGRYLIDKHFGLMYAIGNGGVVLDWIRKNIKTRMVSRDEKVEVIPHFTENKGIIRNIGLSTTGYDILNAGIKALVFQVKNALEIISKIGIKRILMVGGGTKEKMLPELIEKYTGIKVIVPEVREAAGKGAFLLTKGKEGLDGILGRY